MAGTGQSNFERALRKAVEKGDDDDKAVKTLLDAQGGHANVNAVLTDDGTTALYIAISKGHCKIVDVLLDAGADPEKAIAETTLTSPYAAFMVGWRALHLAAAMGSDERIIQKLLAAGANLATTGRDGTQTLYAAVWAGHDNVVEIFLEADVAARTLVGVTALHEASNKGHEKIIGMLHAAGADVNEVTTSRGEAALLYAAQRGHDKSVEMLLAAGATVTCALTHEGFARAQEEWEKAVVLWEKRQEKAKADTDPSAGAEHAEDPGSGPEPGPGSTATTYTHAQNPPPRRYQLTDAMKIIVWRLVALSNEVCRLENGKNSLEGSNMQVSEQGLRKVLYQKIVSAFPEGWMSSGQISREAVYSKLNEEAVRTEKEDGN